LWAGVAFLPLFGFFFASQLKKASRYRKGIMSIFLIGLAVSAMYFANASILQPTHVEVEPFRDFLDTDENSKWRYLTLGFGDAKIQELSILTSASTLDGYYFLARTIPILVNSSIGTLDNAKYFGKQGMGVLGSVLNNASEYNLKWVFCNDPFYYSLLNDTGFVLSFSQDSTGDGRLHGVTIWQKEGIPQINTTIANNAEEHLISLDEYIWGIAPLSVFITMLILSTMPLLKKRKKLTASSDNKTADVKIDCC
jgi:hypothetical protein